jgi:RNA polymerase sigma-70 factor (ECF subfamily)
MQESNLINKLRSGDQEAFRLLVEIYQDRIFRACYNLLQDNDDADDITQDVFVEVYQSLDSFRGESGLHTWMYRIAVNKSLNFIKKKQRKSVVRSIEGLFKKDKSESYFVDDNTGDSKLENSERGIVLQQAINRLPAKQKTAFTLSKVEELSYKEICVIMDMSLPAVESLIHRAKKALQETLKNYYKIDN